MCCLYIHLNKCFGRVLSKYWFGYRERYNAQQCLLTIIEKSSASLDQNRPSTELLTDLSKAFDCLPHDLIIAKLHAYGCDLLLLKLRNSYLRNVHQRVKINNFYSSWVVILFGVSQGPLLKFWKKICGQIHEIKQNVFFVTCFTVDSLRVFNEAVKICLLRDRRTRHQIQAFLGFSWNFLIS